MPARRFFVEGIARVGSAVEIGGGDARKIVRVLRLRSGERIEVVDSAGTVFLAAIELDGPQVLATPVEVLAAQPARGAALRVDVAQAIPKGQRMEFVVEKTTELGAAAILPFYSERSIAREIGAPKLERWRRVARTAAQQCGRSDIPEVVAPLTFDALLARFSGYDAVAFAWELAPRVPLRDALPELLAGARRMLVAIGPEGGFSHDEAEAARGQGAALLWLGTRILRSETAAMAVLAVIDAFAS